MHISACMGVLLPLLVLTTSVEAENWPCWRGPTRQGISLEKNLPVAWNADSNVTWKVSVRGEGWSSPIVWEKNIFLTKTTESGVNCHVLCLDADTGSTVWETKVFEQVPLRKEGRNSYATPTPVTDGRSVWSVFGDGSIAAVEAASGKKLWEHREIKFYSQHGLGASPVLAGDLLIMPYDGSSQGEEKRVGWQIPWEESFILALDKETGKERWHAKRGKSRIAHVTPNILRQNGKELLVSGAGDVVQGFNLQTGERLWSVYSKGEGVVPSIVLGHGLVYSASGFEQPTIRAVRPPGAGAGDAEIVWEQKKGVPSIPSFVLWDDLLFTVTSEGGLASCIEAKSGELVWQERVGGNFYPSPVAADGRIYFTSDLGETTVVEAGREFKILSRNPLNQKCQSSPAISDGRFYIRTLDTLFAIGIRK